MTTLLRLWLAVALTVIAGGDVRAACNLIPSATQTFRSALGATNKPFAAPGDFVEVSVRPALCDGASPGLLPLATSHDVTVVFTPPSKGQARVVLLTADCGAASAKLAACEATQGVGAGNVACVDGEAALALVTRNGVPHLSFRFPDTDALFAPAGDRRTLAGPATIAVGATTDPALPCDLVAKPCSAATDLVACVDDLYRADGTCTPNAHPTFTRFTALPVPNDYQATCFSQVPPCSALATEGRVAVDAAGNLLLPVNWQGVLVSQASVPVPRLLRATIKSPLAFPNPPQVSLASFTPEGAPLPPIFEPQADPSLTAPNVISLFGSADASYTILRVARGLGSCAAGPHAGEPCADSRDCDGATCAPVCVGGTAPPNTPCTKDGDCGSGGRCAALYADFRPLVKSGGPLVLPRLLPGVCQLPPHQACTSNAQCAGGGNLCVTYAFEANTPVALESLTAGSEELFAFTVNEAIDLVDRNGDGDAVDAVVTLRDRTTGASQPLAAPAGCGIPGTPEGRAVARIQEPPFSFAAVATEHDVVAFLESESANNYCDENADGDRGDVLLRVFALGAPEVTSAPRPADAALVVNGRSLAVSGGRVFYRRPEPAGAGRTTTRPAIGPGGAESPDGSDIFAMSARGRWVVFRSAGALVAGDTNGVSDWHLRDRVAGTTVRVSLKTGGLQAATAGAAVGAAVTPDGRFVAFSNADGDLVPGDTNGVMDVFVHDRCVADGVAVPSCTPTTERVSVATGGAQATGASYGNAYPTISADGRFVGFWSDATNLVPLDLNGFADVFVHDRLLDTTERVSVPSGGGEANGTISFLYSMSADGRYVAFDSIGTNLDPPDANPGSDVFVHDRQTLLTDCVSLDGTGAQGFGYAIAPMLSADGRVVAFESDATLAAGDSNGAADVYVRDLDAATTELASVASVGFEPSAIGGFEGNVSPDGRYVVFKSADLASVPFDTNAAPDVFLHDRRTGTTELVSLTTTAAAASTTNFADLAIVSEGGRDVLFPSAAADVVPGDGNGAIEPFVRGVDPGDAAAELTGDGLLDDTVLESLDAATAVATPLCPAGDVAVTAGMAAFLRPEPGGTTTLAKLPLCPLGTAVAGGVDLNGDADAADHVVHLWTGSGGVQNLGLAATAVALSSTHVAAIGPGGTLHTRAVSGGGWTDTGETTDAIQFCGDVVAFLQPTASHLVKLYVPATDTVVATGQFGEQIVCNERIAAFRTPEADQGANLNGPPDADQLDDVLQTWDLSRPECLAASPPGDCVGGSERAVTPCRFEVCDPRIPYRVAGDTVKFLTFEPDQGGEDLNGDGDAADLVIEVYDVATDTVRVIGTVNDQAAGDPTLGGELAGDGNVYVSAGRCLETLAAPPSCATNGDCGPGAFCDAGACRKDQGVCTTTADCPPGIACDPTAGSVPASPDTDGDGVPDHLDNCVDAANGDQSDFDADGVGDACDLAICGNGVVEYDEQCDGASAAGCTGACQPTCTCACADAIGDPEAKVLVRTRNGAGQLKVKALLPLGTYTNEPVTIRLDDFDSAPVARQALGALAAKGTSGTKWEFKTKAFGVQKVQLKLKSTGDHQIALKSKRWFTAAGANQTAANTQVTLTIGTRCFTRAATLKID